MKHAEQYLKLLAQWEQMRPDEIPPAAREEDIVKITEPRLKDATAYIAFRDTEL